MIAVILVFVVVLFGISLLVFPKRSNSDQLSYNNYLLLEARYPQLVKILQGESKPKIIKSTLNDFSFGWNTPNVENVLRFIQYNNFVEIKWNFKARFIWENKTLKLSNKWNFPNDGDEEKMAEKILLYISESYDKNL